VLVVVIRPEGAYLQFQIRCRPEQQLRRLFGMHRNVRVQTEPVLGEFRNLPEFLTLWVRWDPTQKGPFRVRILLLQKCEGFHLSRHKVTTL
jgi:hypothetical protein